MEKRHGSQTYYALLDEMAETHNRKSHDYASRENPSGNYHFAGQLAVLFASSPEDAGFIGRIGEKIYRLANLQKDGKEPLNESVEDTEKDICVITALWMSDRRDRRETQPIKCMEQIEISVIKMEPQMDDNTLERCLSYLEASRDARAKKNQEQT